MSSRRPRRTRNLNRRKCRRIRVGGGYLWPGDVRVRQPKPGILELDVERQLVLGRHDPGEVASALVDGLDIRIVARLYKSEGRRSKVERRPKVEGRMLKSDLTDKLGLQAMLGRLLIGLRFDFYRRLNRNPNLGFQTGRGD